MVNEEKKQKFLEDLEKFFSDDDDTTLIENKR